MTTRALLRLLPFFWALPCSLVGVCLGGGVLLLGGKVRRVGRVLEFFLSPGMAQDAVGKLSPYRAVTIGHVVLGVGDDELARLRAHELVHVGQYESLGVLFFVAYPLASLWAWSRGRCPYRGNHFEIQAYAAADRPHPTRSAG